MRGIINTTNCTRLIKKSSRTDIHFSFCFFYFLKNEREKTKTPQEKVNKVCAIKK